MHKPGAIVLEDEVGDGSLESQVLRLAGAPAVGERPAGKRDLTDTPASEIWRGLGRLLPAGAEDEALMCGVLDSYGFSELTESHRRYLEQVISSWRKL